MKKRISALTFAASLAAGMMLLPVTRDALAKGGASEDEFDRKPGVEFHASSNRTWIREAHRDSGHLRMENDTGKHKEKGKGKHRDKKKKDKHKDKKCGGKKKCPTPKPILEPIHGAPPISPGGDAGSKGGNSGGAPTLKDPGYGQPPKGGSSGPGSPGGPARDPVDRGSGTTIKQN